VQSKFNYKLAQHQLSDTLLIADRQSDPFLQPLRCRIGNPLFPHWNSLLFGYGWPALYSLWLLRLIALV